jgi:outer membrane beta-barrel protein
MKSVLVLFILFLSLSARAETIQFPEDELAPESVLPIFDQPTAVKKRSISLAHRFEVAIGGSYDMTEPFFNPLSLGGELTYYWDEHHGVDLYASYFMSGDRSYVGQINTQAQSNGEKLNLQYAPAPKYLVLGNFIYAPFYGKMSLTKEFVMHLNVFGLAGLGGMEIGNKIEPALSVGLGQKLYFNSSFSLRIDLRLLVHSGPNVAGSGTSPTQNATSEVPTSAFPSRIFYDTLLTFAGTYLIPNS